MEKRKFRILINVAVVCLCLCAIAIGVYSAKTASLNVNGTVGFTAHNCDADIVIKTNGDSINASNERALDGTTVRTTAEVLQSAVKTGSAIGTYANKAEIRGADLTLALKPFYFGDLTDDGSVNNITLSFEITNQSDFSISANVSAVSCDGVSFYNSDGATAFSSDVAEVIDISTKGATSTLTLVLKYTATGDITLADNFTININLQKKSKIKFTFDGTTYSAKIGSTWADWLETAEAKALGLYLDSTDYVVTSGGDYVNPERAMPWGLHSIVKGVDLITDGIDYYPTGRVPEKT